MAAFLIVPVALATLVAASPGDGVDRFLRGLTAFGVAVWAITEGLSRVEGFRLGAVFACWSVVAAGAALVAMRRRGRKKGAAEFGAWFGILCCAGIAAVLLGTLVTARVSPPNSADAMAYHAPRVLYWAEQGGVRDFPTPYLNQIMLQPFAEYVNLQSYVLAGGDWFFNLTQWFASVACVVAVWRIARELGAGARGGAMAALFCATIPSGVLASSGAKNDYVLAMWLAAAVVFALRWRRSGGVWDGAWMGAALGLALFTKATAYLFAPWVLAAICARPLWARKGKGARAMAVACGIAVAINAPLIVRNIELSGRPMGFDSAQGDGHFRWSNDTFGWKQTVSNVLRNSADQLGMRSSAWNQRVYDAVLRAHAWVGANVNDPATTWPQAEYTPPRNDNHEADAGNPYQVAILLFVALLLGASALRGRDRLAAAMMLALAMGFVAFCFYLKWQPYMSRLFLPLFVLGAPLVGVVAGWDWPWLGRLRVKQEWILAAVCLFLLDGARRPVLNNWVRPLRGPGNIFQKSREEQYFADMTQFGSLTASYFGARDYLAQSGCGTVGIDASRFQLEYPLEALLRDLKPGVQFEHVGVENASKKFAPPVRGSPCAVVCLLCGLHQELLQRYRGFGAETRFGETVVWVSQ